MFVLVEAISMFRMRYLVEVEDDGDPRWACDTVVMQEAKEFSQEHLDEVITSHRVVTKEEAVKVFKEDHSYLSSWSDDTIEQQAFTMLSDLEKEKEEA